MSVPRSCQIGDRKDAPHIMGCVSLSSRQNYCMDSRLQFPSCSSCVKETATHDWHSTCSVLCYSEHSSSVFQGRSILCLIKSWHQYNLWHDCIELDRLLTLFEVAYVYSIGCPFKTRSYVGWQEVVSCHLIKICLAAKNISGHCTFKSWVNFCMFWALLMFTFTYADRAPKKCSHCSIELIPVSFMF